MTDDRRFINPNLIRPDGSSPSPGQLLRSRTTSSPHRPDHPRNAHPASGTSGAAPARVAAADEDARVGPSGFRNATAAAAVRRLTEALALVRGDRSAAKTGRGHCRAPPR